MTQSILERERTSIEGADPKMVVAHNKTTLHPKMAMVTFLEVDQKKPTTETGREALTVAARP